MHSLVDRYGLETFLDAYGRLVNSSDEADRLKNRQHLAEIFESPLEQLEAAWKGTLKPKPPG